MNQLKKYLLDFPHLGSFTPEDYLIATNRD
jgi:hypothetical protein